MQHLPKKWHTHHNQPHNPTQRHIHLPSKLSTKHTFAASYGHDHTNKLTHHYRFLFNNINGIPLSETSLHEITITAQSLDIDWIGLAETHIDSSKKHVRHQVITALSHRTHGFKSASCVFSQSDLTYSGDIKYGGVLQFATNNLASRTVASHSDRYGRWTSQTYSGRQGVLLTTITAYRVANGCNGPHSAFYEKRSMLVTENRGANVRDLFIHDLLAFIQQCQKKDMR